MEDLGDLFSEWLKSTNGSRDKEEIQKISHLLQSLQTHLEDEIKGQIEKEKKEEDQVRQRLQRLKSGPDGKADTQLQGNSLADIFKNTFEKRTNASSALQEQEASVKSDENETCLSKKKSEFLNEIPKRAITFCKDKFKQQPREWTNTVMLVDSSKDNSKDLKNMEHFREMQKNLSEYTVPQILKQYDKNIYEDLKKEYELNIADKEGKIYEYRHACVKLAWELALQKEEHKLIWDPNDKSVNFSENKMFYFDHIPKGHAEVRVVKPALVCGSNIIQKGLINVIKKKTSSQ